MGEAKQLIKQLFKINNINIPPNRIELFDRFFTDAQNMASVKLIIQNQEMLMAKWKQEERIADIIQQPVRVLNATVGKPYETKFDFDKLNWKDIIAFEFSGLEEEGLFYDAKTRQITGIPTESGDRKIVFRFKVDGQPQEAHFNEKILTLIVNPDPKSLWKNLESDSKDPYWKEDEITLFAPFAQKHILGSSKRGRSHANVGSFREDDFRFKELNDGWSVVVVADGAGSGKMSRKGSEIACNGIIEYFNEASTMQSMVEFDELINQHQSPTEKDIQIKIKRFVYNNLGKAVFQVHKQLEEFAIKESLRLEDLRTTLIFTLMKKYHVGYALLSFGVGDCPMAVLNPDVSEVTLLNWIDVGEYGGGTRFITMSEIFKSDKFATRFGFNLVKDFSYLMLMTDGIYDPKFVVEANLANITKWREFLEDLNGNNEDKIKVELTSGNKDIVKQFSNWMDFWSVGNHDDRTLVIVF